MRWSLRLVRVAGIDIRVHSTFALVVLIGSIEFFQGFGLLGALFGALLVCSLFLCVTLHELGHSLVAQRFGVQVREIVLLPIGGIARLSAPPKKSIHEFWIALAGPLVNVVIAALLCVVLQVSPVELLDAELWLSELENPSLHALAVWLLLGNVMLAVFNMIPALPMDGGRVLRALIALAIGDTRATQWTALLGQALSVLLIGAGFMLRAPLQIIIGLFVFVGASQERVLAKMREFLLDFSAGEVCDPHALRFSPAESLGTAIDHMLRSSQSQFAVAQNGELFGTLSRDDAVATAQREGLLTPISTAMQRDFLRVSSELSLAEVRAKLLESGVHAAVVEDSQGTTLGVIGFEDLERVARLVERLASAGIRRLPAVEREVS